MVAVLRLSPGDVDALACKAVANLQLGEYEEAAKVLSHKKLEDQMQFERVSSSHVCSSSLHQQHNSSPVGMSITKTYNLDFCQ